MYTLWLSETETMTHVPSMPADSKANSNDSRSRTSPQSLLPCVVQVAVDEEGFLEADVLSNTSSATLRGTWHLHSTIVYHVTVVYQHKPRKK